MVYGLCDQLVEWVPYRIPVGEMSLPFLPGFAILYLSLNLLILWVYFRCEEKDLPFLFGSLMVQTPIAGLCFLLFPLQAPETMSTTDSWFFKVADLINLKNNFLPSLHVAYATTCAFFYRRFLVTVWGLGIMVSTLLTHQHYPVDVVAGILLALLVSLWCQRGGRVFSLSLWELARCSLRHRRYAVIALGLLFHLLCRPKLGWRTLLGFTYLQRIDDIIDGHLTTECEPEDIATQQIRQWKSGDFESDSLSTLGYHLHAALPDSQHIVPLIQEMVLDRQRVRDDKLLNESELQSHLVRTFELSIDLMLSATEADLRCADVQGLSSLLAWCSVVRDLEEDLELGLVNLPQTVWENANFVEWFQRQHQQAVLHYQQAQESLRELQGRSGHRILKLFHRSVKKYLDKNDNELLAQIVKNHH